MGIVFSQSKTDHVNIGLWSCLEIFISIFVTNAPVLYPLAGRWVHNINMSRVARKIQPSITTTQSELPQTNVSARAAEEVFQERSSNACQNSRKLLPPPRVPTSMVREAIAINAPPTPSAASSSFRKSALRQVRRRRRRLVLRAATLTRDAIGISRNGPWGRIGQLGLALKLGCNYFKLYIDTRLLIIRVDHWM